MIEIKANDLCYHCGDHCGKGKIHLDNKIFCCIGCKTVYEILKSKDLSEYYRIEDRPGIQQKDDQFSDFAFLDIPQIKQELITYSDDRVESVTLKLPGIHCSSCLWLLERLSRLHRGVVRSELNFLRKEASITYNKEEISLRKLAELLKSIGYEPNIALDESKRKQATRKRDLGFIYRLGIAGFAFGNIMLLSFPEYFEEGMYEDPSFGAFFGYINLILATPVFFYCANPYFISAWKGLRNKFLNIDVPVSVGILVLFFRSAYEILSHTGSGYMDSLTGLVFFLLIGRWFQNRTYQALSFEKDYEQYFPLGITRISKKGKETVLLNQVETGDRLLIRSGELIPADSMLKKGKALIDYSFVTGEADPVEVSGSQILYAGGRQRGEQIEIEITKTFSQSYLMQLWKYEDKSVGKTKSLNGIIDRVSQYFTLIVLLVAIGSGIFWYFLNPALMVHAVTSVLIIACPCALALTIPFVYGNGLKLLEKTGLYLKDAIYIERLSEIDYIVFDKTGTITSQTTKQVSYHGRELKRAEKMAVSALASNSGHPLSRAVVEFISMDSDLNITDYKEDLGKGISGKVANTNIRVGSPHYLGITNPVETTAVHVEIDEIYAGYFSITNAYRKGLKSMLNSLGPDLPMEVMTGDGDSERSQLVDIFGHRSNLHFNMLPMDKLMHIKNLQSKGHKVLMIGDGLNDAGAISESHVGISISDNIYGFLPSCDAIMEANFFHRLGDILSFCKTSISVVKANFLISFSYNIIGMLFAVQGHLSPVLAAILMPVSSVSVVAFAVIATNYLARRNKFFSFDKTDKSQALN
ncbi:MAG: heavy metal translocating P-type ATPase metal-binding domain-containing protein [Vicingaceae bacterium]